MSNLVTLLIFIKDRSGILKSICVKISKRLFNVELDHGGCVNLFISESLHKKIP